MYTSAEKWCRLRKVCWFNRLLPIRENSWQKACPKTEIDLQSPNILLFFQMLNLLKIRCSIGVALTLCAMILQACVPDAPRLNPFDPGSGSEATAISGRVFTYYEPRQPLAGVLLRLQPLNIAAVTDAAGNFSFANVPAGDYQLIASGENWSADTTTVSVSAQNLQQERTFFLNALPRVSRYRFFSEHIDRIFPGEQYIARLSVIAEDPDGPGDIRELHLEIPGLSFARQLAPTARVDSFTLTIEDIELPENNLFLLTEYECNIILFDDPGAQVSDGPFRLSRIIEQKPLPLSPARFDTTDARPQFQWQRFLVPYQFSYQVDIYNLIAGIPVLVGQQTLADPFTSQWQSVDSLADGQYYWTLGVRDLLGNFSRSEEQYFLIRQ